MKHALETQADLVNLARSLAPETVEVWGGDGRIFFDSASKRDLLAAREAFRSAYRPVAAGRKVRNVRHGDALIWRPAHVHGVFRFGVRLDLTESEQSELLAGAWYSRQAASSGGKGLKVDAPTGR